MNENCSVLVADDHPLITDSLAAALRPFGISTVTSVTDGTQVIERFGIDRPDVLVLDLWLGQVRGLEVARDLLAQNADAKVVIYSQFDKDEFIREAYRLGVKAFVPKSATQDILAEAIHSACRNETYFIKIIAERMALMGLRGEESPRAKLNERELKTFQLMALGLTNAEIAAKQNISLKTVGSRTQGIRDCLGVQRPADITRLALKHQLIDD